MYGTDTNWIKIQSILVKKYVSTLNKKKKINLLVSYVISKCFFISYLFELKFIFPEIYSNVA